MIVIGLDVHKQSVTAVAIDEAGRPIAETTVIVGRKKGNASCQPFDTRGSHQALVL